MSTASNGFFPDAAALWQHTAHILQAQNTVEQVMFGVA